MDLAVLQGEFDVRFCLTAASIGAAMAFGVCAAMAFGVCAAMAFGVCAARAGGDCAPLGHVATHPATREATITPFDKHDFNVTVNGETAPVTVSGKTCDQAYALKPGTTDVADAEIEKQHRAMLAKLGARISPSPTTRRPKDGPRTGA